MHLLSVVVLVVGLALTAGAAFTSSRLYRATEANLVDLRTRDAALVLSATMPDIKSRLMTAANLAANSRDPARSFAESLDSDVGQVGSDAQFRAASLYRLVGAHPARLATLGSAPPAGDPAAMLRAAMLRAASRHPTVVVSGIVGPPNQPLIAFAAVPSGSTDGVVALSGVRSDWRATTAPGSPFAGLEIALYLGGQARPANLIQTSFPAGPLPANTARITVPFGTNRLLLVMASPRPLAGMLFANLWWIAAAAGALVTLGVALLVERLVRRREIAAANAERLARLQATAIALGGAMFHDDVQAAVTELAVPAAGATAGALVQRSASGRTVEVMATVGYPPQGPPGPPVSIDSPSPLATAVRSGEMVLVKDAAAMDFADSHIVRPQRVSYAALPLRVQGRCIGALELSFSARQSFDRVQIAFFESLVRHLASALERTRLHEETMHLLADRTEIAEGLQQSLLPPRLPDVPGVDLAARYRPSGGSAPVGGDFYDAFSLGAGRWLLVIGDVEGRGIEAAAVTGLVRHALRALMGTGMAPSAALHHVNRLLLAQDPGRGAPGRRSRFCTAAVAVLDVSGADPVLTLSLAGHPAPLRVSSGGVVSPVGAHGSLLGVDGEGRFTDETLRLAPGDTLVLFSDGVTERRGPAGEFFGEDHLADTVRSGCREDADTVANAVEDAVRAFSPQPLGDDVAILVLSVPPVVATATTGVGPATYEEQPAGFSRP